MYAYMYVCIARSTEDKNKNAPLLACMQAQYLAYTHFYTLQYAGEGFPVLFKIEIGAIDRGADVRFLSQYPSENEILFPPLSYIEVVGNVR
jgi:hypothetical protein